jgi:heme/copper-type cytochrome/quinol oxidase subunit 2
MADIDVVRKRPVSVWVWIIAAIILAVVLFALFAMRADPTPARSSASEVIGPKLTLTATALA